MTTINFKDRTEQIEIAGKVYNICVSNFEFMKKARENLDMLEKAKTLLTTNDDIESVLTALESFTNFMLDNDFDRIWEACNHNLFDLLDVTNVLGKIIQKGFEYKAKQYV